MKKEVVIAIIILALITIGITLYFVLKGGETASVPEGDYAPDLEEVDYAAGTDVGDNIAEGTQGNVFDTDTNPFD